MEESITIDFWKRSQKDIELICNVYQWRVKEVFLLHKARIQGEIWHKEKQLRGWMIAVNDEAHLNLILASLRKLKQDGVDLMVEEP